MRQAQSFTSAASRPACWTHSLAPVRWPFPTRTCFARSASSPPPVVPWAGGCAETPGVPEPLGGKTRVAFLCQQVNIGNVVTQFLSIAPPMASELLSGHPHLLCCGRNGGAALFAQFCCLWSRRSSRIWSASPSRESATRTAVSSVHQPWNWPANCTWVKYVSSSSSPPYGGSFSALCCTLSAAVVNRF